MSAKKILVVYYSQSGQMHDIADQFCTSFSADSSYVVSYEQLKPVTGFPFPWSAFSFFNAFPETFKEKPIALQPFSNNIMGDYDLVILAYQPWFLTPSPVISSFLQTEEGKQLLTGKKVVTLIGCRNMWLGAQEKVKKRLAAVGAKIIANIALVDKSPNVVSVVTILRWLLWGKKEKWWILPAAGVSEADVAMCATYGAMTKAALEMDKLNDLQQSLNEKGAVEIVPELVLMEKRGQRSFSIWSGFVGGKPIGSAARNARVYLFMFLLPTAVFILSPLLMIVSALMLRLKRDELMADVEYYKGNGPLTPPRGL
ncbi:MAG: dialkylresorcinol condensing enzyme DarA [Bacteroidetes bacterium]|nr:dialkylresorcinol condensing enzyme DarA [Bacteroidota bacterium]